MNRTVLAQALRFEGCLLSVIWRSRECMQSRLVLAAALLYWISPWQVIPDRTPVFGYFDQLLFTFGGLAVARLLIPPKLECRVARHLVPDDGPGSPDGQLYGVPPAIHIRSELVIRWLTLKRRVLRFRAHATNAVQKFRGRWRAAIVSSSPVAFVFALVGYRLWWFLRSPFAPPRTAIGPIVVIGGAARSGTTLLRTTLGRHPLIAGLPETTVFLRRISSPATVAERLGRDSAEVIEWQRESRSQAEFIGRVQRAILEDTGKVMWAEKTPNNIRRIRFIRRRFPDAKVVHILRDGRDVVCSLRRTPFAKIDHAAWNSVAASRRCAVQWRRSVEAGIRLRGDPRYYEVRYEDLVRHPEPTLRDLMRFLELPWDECLLESGAVETDDPDMAAAAGQIFDSSVGRWRRDLSQADRSELRVLIGPLLVRLAYERDLIWPGRMAPKRCE